MKTTRYCYALDLINDPEKIKTYIAYHKKVWPEIIEHIKDSGIVSMEIYNVQDRLFMITEVDENFSPKSKHAQKNEEWQELMWEYQKALPNAKPNEKWVLMDEIFAL